MRRPAVAQVQQKRTLLRAYEEADQVDGAADAADVLTADGLDSEIMRLLVPAIVAVFLDPAMALIDTGDCPEASYQTLLLLSRHHAA